MLGGVVEGGEGPGERPRCPRCGGPVSWVERHVRGGRVYYVAVHYEGYTKAPDGRVRKRVRKCYLGPSEYEYVSRTHEDLGLVLKGLSEPGRVIDYLDAFINSLERLDLDEATLEAIIQKLEELVARLRKRFRPEAPTRG
jgi:hypothetical protein